MWTKKKNVREENDLKKEVEKGGEGMKEGQDGCCYCV